MRSTSVPCCAASTRLLWGLGLGLVMGLAGLAAGSAIGIVAALANVFGPRPAQIIVRLYVGLIRNVPILVLALFAFFALPQYGIRFSNITTFAAVLAIYAGAYLAEVVPGGNDHRSRAASSMPLGRSG